MGVFSRTCNYTLQRIESATDMHGTVCYQVQPL